MQAERQRSARLTEGSVERHLVRMTVPMIGGLFATMFFQLADTYFVGRLGPIELAAMGFCAPVMMVLISVAIGLGAGASSVVARAIGEGDDETIRRLATDSLVLSALLVVALTALGLVTIDPLFRLLGAEPAVLEQIRVYMRVWYLGLGFLILPMVGTSAIRATGDTRIPALVLVGGAVLNLVLDPILIFGLAGAPRLGLAGAAWATVLARAATLVVTIWALQRGSRLLVWSVPSYAVLLGSWRKVLHVGAPAAATNVIIPAALTALTPLLASFGQTVVAGFGAAGRVEALALIFFYSLSSVVGPFAGQNQGAGRWERIDRMLRSVFVFSFSFGLLTAVALALLRRPIAQLFSDDPTVVSTIATYLLLAPISYGAYGVVMVVNAVFNGLGLPMRGVAISTGRMVVLYLPLAYLGSRLFGVPGIFAGAAVANLTAGLVATVWGRSHCQRRLPGVGGAPHGLPGRP